MQKISTVLLFVLILGLASSCSKKHAPSKSDNATVTSKSDSSYVTNDESGSKKVAVIKKKSPPLPQTITVNDAAARKSVDGRLYYDVQGHRYWKNFKDGKYYLFNKKMYKDPAFKPTSN